MGKLGLVEGVRRCLKMLILHISHEGLFVVLILGKDLAHLLSRFGVAEEKVVLLVVLIVNWLGHILKHAVFIIVVDWVHWSKLLDHLRSNLLFGTSLEWPKLIWLRIIRAYLLLFFSSLVIWHSRLVVFIMCLHHVFIFLLILILIYIIINILAILVLITWLNFSIYSDLLFLIKWLEIWVLKQHLIYTY